MKTKKGYGWTMRIIYVWAWRLYGGKVDLAELIVIPWEKE